MQPFIGPMPVISFVCVDVHKSKIVLSRLNSDLSISEDQGSVSCLNLNCYYITCIESPLLLLLSSDVDVSLSNDYAVVEFERACGANQLDSRGACEVSGKSYRSVNSKSSCVCL